MYIPTCHSTVVGYAYCRHCALYIVYCHVRSDLFVVAHYSKGIRARTIQILYEPLCVIVCWRTRKGHVSQPTAPLRYTHTHTHTHTHTRINTYLYYIIFYYTHTHTHVYMYIIVRSRCTRRHKKKREKNCRK
jgi:hypothetical protein